MGAASNQPANSEVEHVLGLTLRGCDLACAAAASAGDILSSGAAEALQLVREREEELDQLDRDINEKVTGAMVHCRNGMEAHELLACLKVMYEMERIGDLLLSFANRARSVQGRLAPPDVKDLSTMSVLLEKMLAEATGSFRKRDPNLAVGVLRADGEMDRLRNLLFVRHIENPELGPKQESFHVVFMTQALERCGDHAKNIAEEVVHLVTGRSVRHFLRTLDKPDEVRFLEFLRKKA
jgi:phosphate transport system protein